MSGIFGGLVASGLSVVNPLIAASSIGDQAIGGGNSAGGVTFQSDGSIIYPFTGLSNTGTQISLNWYSSLQAGIGSSFWIRATVTSGTLTTGTTGSWVSLSTGENFTKGPAASGSVSCTITFEIATDAGGANIVSTSTGWIIGYSHT